MNEVFKALNDPARREILKLLRRRDMTAGDIAAKFSMTAPSISHHLDKLKRAGLVSAAKEGQFVRYSLNMTIMDDLIEYLLTFKKSKT
jgi:ArsR family transcriptional regulator, arsenate/arsenite/antimonite-responsive transcriptional repressor